MKLISIIVTLFVAMSAVAQAQQYGVQIPLQPIPCNGASNVPGGTQVAFIENFVDGNLPGTLHIERSMLWMEGIHGVSNVTGNVIVALDPQQVYTDSGYPGTQTITPTFLTFLNIYENFGAASSQKSEITFTPPVLYNSINNTLGVPGDILILAPECGASGGTGVYPEPLLTIHTLENLQTLPQAPTTAVAFNAVPASPNSAFTARNLFPAFSGTPSQCRAHVLSSSTQGGTMTLSHVSICQQSGATSSCQAAPVEMKFSRQSGSSYSGGGYAVPAMLSAWTDWTPFSPAGRPILITATDISGWFSFKASGSYGAWASGNTTDWASVSLTGTVFADAGQTYIVDKVQCQ